MLGCSKLLQQHDDRDMITVRRAKSAINLCVFNATTRCKTINQFADRSANYTPGPTRRETVGIYKELTETGFLTVTDGTDPFVFAPVTTQAMNDIYTLAVNIIKKSFHGASEFHKSIASDTLAINGFDKGMSIKMLEMMELEQRLVFVKQPNTYVFCIIDKPIKYRPFLFYAKLMDDASPGNAIPGLFPIWNSNANLNSKNRDVTAFTEAEQTFIASAQLRYLDWVNTNPLNSELATQIQDCLSFIYKEILESCKLLDQRPNNAVNSVKNAHDSQIARDTHVGGVRATADDDDVVDTTSTDHSSETNAEIIPVKATASPVAQKTQRMQQSLANTCNIEGKPPVARNPDLTKGGPIITNCHRFGDHSSACTPVKACYTYMLSMRQLTGSSDPFTTMAARAIEDHISHESNLRGEVTHSYAPLLCAMNIATSTVARGVVANCYTATECRDMVAEIKATRDLGSTPSLRQSVMRDYCKTIESETNSKIDVQQLMSLVKHLDRYEQLSEQMAVGQSNVIDATVMSANVNVTALANRLRYAGSNQGGRGQIETRSPTD